MYEKKQPSILVVDDNSENLHVLAHILRGNHYKVATAKSGMKALEFIEKKKPELILMDIMMPEMDGYEVCKKLKDNPETRDIPIIFISALSQTQDKVRGFQVGGVDYITKPFRKEEVFARIGAHLKLKRTQEELSRANEKLLEANTAKDKLFSIIAHDLRSPISSLIGMLEILEYEPDVLDGEKKNTFFTELSSSVKNVYHLLENLLAWARNQRGQMPFMPETFSVKKAINNSLSLFQNKINDKQIQLEIRVANDLTAFADSNMFMTVMRNLISNALKFTPRSGTIQIRAKALDDGVEIAVADTGVGIPEDSLSKLFQSSSFFTTFGTENEKGSGLGLNLCRELVERHGGKIHAENRKAQGARFYFTLPLTNDEF